MRNAAAGALLAGVLLFAACTSGVPATPTPTELPASATAHLNTHTGPVVRSTLPASWTPTFPPQPTDTATPTPVTPTATATLVPVLAALCESFSVDAEFADGRTYAPDETIAIVFGTSLTAVRDPETNAVVPLVLRFLATHEDSGENLGVQAEGGQLAVMQMAASRLGTPGRYAWKAYATGVGLGELCAHEGHFFINAAEATEMATGDG